MLDRRPLRIVPVYGIPFMQSETPSHSHGFSAVKCTVVGGKKKNYILFVGSVFEENKLPEGDLFLLFQRCPNSGSETLYLGLPQPCCQQCLPFTKTPKFSCAYRTRELQPSESRAPLFSEDSNYFLVNVRI